VILHHSTVRPFKTPLELLIPSANILFSPVLRISAQKERERERERERRANKGGRGFCLRLSKRGGWMEKKEKQHVHAREGRGLFLFLVSRQFARRKDRPKKIQAH